MATKNSSWTHKVVKRMRGSDGQYFDFPTAGTFRSEEAAREYAERFAREQGAGRVYGARIVVRSRRGNETVAVYKSDDYMTSRAEVSS